MTRRDHDLIVVGGGPAGTTLASLVRKYNPGARVLLVEKARFPRHHVGESLLPGMIPVLQEMGAYDAIAGAGFPEKLGVTYVWGKDRAPWDADFASLNLEMAQRYGTQTKAAFTWQVLRSRYDEILLERAQALGVETLLETRAVEPIEKAGAVAGLMVESAGGERRALSCGLLADCSGQQGFLSRFKDTRAYFDGLKNVAGYAYFRGAEWKFRYPGEPDKTKLFICSVPEGWFWYIPVARDLVSVGLVSKAVDIQRRAARDFRAHFFKALTRCRELRPLLKRAALVRGIDAAEPDKDFFSAGDWSFTSKAACGDGWLSAGDAAFFLDPLLSSGVMMAHLSGQRAAYCINSVWAARNAAMRRALWADYDLFCKDVGASFLAMIRYWYHQEPSKAAWCALARRELAKGAAVDLSNKSAFLAVTSGFNLRLQKVYTEPRLRVSANRELATWGYGGNENEVIVPFLFLFREDWGAALRRRKRPESGGLVRPEPEPAGVQGGAVPFWKLRPDISVTFLPDEGKGLLRPQYRVHFREKKARSRPRAAPVRLLPRSYLAVLRQIDGIRTVAEIRARLYAELALPQSIIDFQARRLLADLSSLGAVGWRTAKARKAAAPRAAAAGGALREGERLLQLGEIEEAETLLSKAAAASGESWPLALRGEARRRLGRLAEAREDFDRVVAGPSADAEPGSLEDSLVAFNREIERGWFLDAVLAWRGKAREQSGDLEGARKDADAALSLNGRCLDALTLRARLARAAGELETARKDLEAARSLLAPQPATQKSHHARA